MRFLVEPVSKSLNASIEERATTCDLRIDVAGANACSFWDERDGSHYEWVRVAAVHLAEGIASDWWAIFGGRDRRHSILPYRNEYAHGNRLREQQLRIGSELFRGGWITPCIATDPGLSLYRPQIRIKC